MPARPGVRLHPMRPLLSRRVEHRGGPAGAPQRSRCGQAGRPGPARRPVAHPDRRRPVHLPGRSRPVFAPRTRKAERVLAVPLPGRADPGGDEGRSLLLLPRHRGQRRPAHGGQRAAPARGPVRGARTPGLRDRPARPLGRVPPARAAAVLRPGGRRHRPGPLPSPRGVRRRRQPPRPARQHGAAHLPDGSAPSCWTCRTCTTCPPCRP